MARPLRIEFPGALYHVISRGNARAPIFVDDPDRLRLLDILGDVVDQFAWICHAYCLMPNHYHLVIETPEANLSRGMRQLNGVYTQRFNRRHDRVGHVLQGRFKAILVEREAHFLELTRYVVLNPVRAEMVRDPQEYRWSSLRAALGRVPPPRWLTVEPLLEQFGSPARYREFVRGGIGRDSPCAKKRGSLLGSKEFAREVARELEARTPQPGISRRECAAHQEPLAWLFPPRVLRNPQLRDRRIRAVSRTHAYSLAEIARHLGLHKTTVSKIARSA